MMEIWRDIKGFEGLYQVSNAGRVRSLDRWARNNQCGSERFVKGRMIAQRDNGCGYLTVPLCKQGKSKRVYVHRLVAEAFVPNPENKSQVNHLDYNKMNNSCDNLEWCTPHENTLYSVERMKKPKRNIEKMHRPKTNPKPSSTGYRYIGKRNGWYRVHIGAIGVEKQFKTLAEAIEYRDTEVNKARWLIQ